MKPIRAEFIQAKKPSLFAWACGVALGIASLAAAAATLSEWNQARLRSEQVQMAIATHNRAPSPTPAAPPQPYDANARELMANRAFAWTDALTMLESTAVVGVTISQIDFAASDRSMRAEVTFVDYSNVLDYLNALNTAAPTIHWSLSQTQAQSGTGTSMTAVVLGAATSR